MQFRVWRGHQSTILHHHLAILYEDQRAEQAVQVTVRVAVHNSVSGLGLILAVVSTVKLGHKKWS